MRRRFRYDKETKSVIPLNEWLAKNAESVNPASYYVLPDIEPYQAVTGDMAGKWITSRSEHREFLRRNNLIEVGNEKDYIVRNRGMSPDNPNLMSESKHEEQICRSLSRNLERLRSR